MYDFILFENQWTAVNHCKDLTIIARLLKLGGYSVAIANCFHEREYCCDSQFPIIDIQHTCNIEKNTLMHSKIWFVRVIGQLLWRRKLNRFFRETITQLLPLTRNIYVGSYYPRLPTSVLTSIPKDKNIFIWGLRSFWFKRKTKSFFKFHELNSLFLNYLVRHKDNIYFFVSDELIRKEFVELGFSSRKLIIRRERVCEISHPLCNRNQTGRNESFNLLTLGMLRRDKQIERCINAVLHLGQEDINYIIAGRFHHDDGYHELLKAQACGSDAIDFRIGWMSNEAFENTFDEADFLVLCDKKQESCVSNGTMNEALLKFVPIIAPDYEPYNFYVNKYGVGILYDLNDENALASAIIKARQIGKRHFEANISNYISLLNINKVATELRTQLDAVL